MATKASYCALALAMLPLVGCNHTPVEDPSMYDDAKTPLELNNNRALYEGKKVLVRGYLYVDAEAICLVEPEFSLSESPPRDAEFSVLGLALLTLNTKQLAGKEIVFVATYKSNLTPEPGFLLKGCGKSGVVIEEAQTPHLLQNRRGASGR